MVKKRVVKNKSEKKESHENSHEKILIENTVALQKVMVNLASKVDNLTGQMSKLLQLFEVSAKTLAEKQAETMSVDKDYKKMIEKIDSLVEQNKIIAKGLTLLHEANIEPPAPQQRAPQQMQIAQRAPQQNYYSESTVDVNEYQKSISASPQKFNPLPKS